MNNSAYILTYDVGTTGTKACLYRLGEVLEFINSNQVDYPLLVTDDGGAEQKIADWWQAICENTKVILANSKVNPDQIRGISFCCQMQGFIPVDRCGQALRNPMIWLDGRSTKQIAEGLYHGLFRIEKMNGYKVLKSLYITGGVAATAKDPLWKYFWVRDNEPEIFSQMHKWLDVKDYMNLRCTGKFTTTPDSANLTFLYNTRPNKLEWSASMCKTFGVDPKYLPPVIQATDSVGGLLPEAAAEMGLTPGTPVFGGGGDVACISLGAGCTDLHDTHIYVGTSGWVVSNVKKRMVDITNFMASILGAMPDRYNYVAEQETSGLCMQWVRDHLAVDAIGVYMKEHQGKDTEEDLSHLYDMMNKVVSETPPGAGNALFTPWLHGNRAPRQDPYVRAMFFNIGWNTSKRMLVRAVLEGVAFHKRWMLEAVENKIPYQEKLVFVGGGARSEVWCQIMADITGRTIATIDKPQDVGTIGAAILVGIGLGLIPSFQKAKSYLPIVKNYSPRPEFKPMYDRNFKVFKQLYENNKRLYRQLNQRGNA